MVVPGRRLLLEKGVARSPPPSRPPALQHVVVPRRAEYLPRPVRGPGQLCCTVLSEVKVHLKKNVGYKEVTDAW